MRDRFHTTRLAVALATVFATLAFAPGAMAADPIGLQCTDGSLAGNTRTFDLTARAGTMETPDGNSNLMWSYAVTGGDFQTPGPVLCANEGEVVHVNLTNALTVPTSIVFPGQKGIVTGGSGPAGIFTKEAAAGGTASYEFTAGSPGTFVYESGTDPAKQVEMGLASALVVRPAGNPTWAYNSSRTEFNSEREYILILNEIDPELHSAVENGDPYDVLSLHNRYYTINGRAFPDTLQDNNVPWLPTQPYGSLVKIQPFNVSSNPLPAMIRIVNVGLQPHPFHPHGQSLRQVGNDGRLVLTTSGGDAATERFGETVASGATQDYLLSYTDQDNFSPSNPSPGAAAIPDYQDSIFKDANTWYSGAPYLGTVGDLPDGTASQNVCGAFYFPWHSHALNEFANFEAAFGGMATMLRVDPPVGCGTPGLTTRTAAPASTTITTGTSLLSSGNATNLATADGNRYNVVSTVLGTRTVAWYGTFTGLPAAGAGVANMQIAYTGRNRRYLINTGNPFTCSQVLRIWQWSSSTWVTLNTSAVGNTSDVVLTNLATPGTESQYVNASGQVRIGVTCTGASPTNTTFRSEGDLMQITYDAP
jgi:hypothetical protein